MSLIVAHGLTCVLGHEPLFEELDFVISAGEVVLLSGANGSGKSTFLRVLVGAQEVSEGTVELEGHRLEELSPAARELRAPFVDQSPLLNWDVTSIDNLIDTVSVGSSLRDWFLTRRHTIRASILAEYQELIEKFGLSEVMHRPARELSIGQRRLLMLLRALRRRPDGKARVLLLDEPLAGLHKERVKTVLEVVASRISDGWAVIVAEHLPQIEALSPRVLKFPFRKQKTKTCAHTVAKDQEPLIHETRDSSRSARSGDARKCLLQLSSLSAGYYDWEIVGDVSLTVREQEITAIVGPNASGKSTLFRGLFNDEGTKAWLRGQIHWESQPVRHMRDGQRISPHAVAWLPQERFNFPGLTVEQTLGGALVTPEFRGLKAAMKDLVGGLRRIEGEKREAVLTLVQRLRETRPDGKTTLESRWETLSGGERAMASLAIGLVNMPTVIFLDEPAANLDVRSLKDLQAILRRYVEDRRAGCLLIEHRLTFLDGFADHVVAIGVLPEHA